MTIFEARAKRLTDDTYRFTCGRRGIDGWCSGHLGTAKYLTPVRYPDGSIRSEWVLTHPHAIYQLPGEDGYRISAPTVDPASGQQVGRKEGRRPFPARLRAISGTRRVFGKTPVLPVNVWCPTCDRANRVAPPTPIG